MHEPTQREPNQIEQIRQLRRDYRLSEAMLRCQKALTDSPHSVDLRCEVGHLHLDLGDPVTALEEFLLSLSLSPDHLDAKIGTALALLGCGRTQEANSLLLTLEKLFPQNAAVLRALGNLAVHQGNLGDGKRLYQQALKLIPKDAETYNDLANLHQMSGQWREAEANYRRAILYRPRYAIAHYNLGAVLLELGRRQEALVAFGTASNLDPEFYEAMRDYAFTLQITGRFNEALVAMFHALALEQEDGLLYTHLVQTLAKMKAYPQLVEVCQKWMRLSPQEPEPYYRAAQALFLMGKAKEALPLCAKAVQLRPQNVPFLLLNANTLANTRRYQEAEPLFRQVRALEPSNLDAIRDYSQLLGLTGRLDEAEALLWQDTEQPHQTAEDAKMRVMRGWIRMGQQRFSEAQALFEEAVRSDTKSAQAHFGIGHVSFLTGDYRRGYEEMEWRLQYSSDRPHPAKAKPRWEGQEIRGKRLLVYTNHGLGDELQFLRFLPFVKERAKGTVVYACYPQLRPLYTEISGVDEIVAFDPTQPFEVRFDYQIEQMSLPLYSSADPTEIPLLDAEFYIAEEKRERWRDYVSEKPGLKVGLRWAGNPANATDPYRSADLADFSSLLEIPGVSWISLQTDGGTARIAELGYEDKIADPAELLTDFGETTALMQHLDLIISVDTSVVHLAGTLRRPVWTLLAASMDWRWLLERSDSPWYPTMRLFRQSKLYDWSDVIAEVGEALQARIVSS